MFREAYNAYHVGFWQTSCFSQAEKWFDYSSQESKVRVDGALLLGQGSLEVGLGE